MFRSAPVRAVRGVSLIEVLVAIVIFSLGLLGLALMELKGASFTKEASARTAAILQARSLVDRMQANPNGLAEYAAASSVGGIPTIADCPCTPPQLADNDLAEWLYQIQASAPQATNGSNFGKVTANTDGSYTITVSWNGLLDISGSKNVSESVIYIPPQLGIASS